MADSRGAGHTTQNRHPDSTGRAEPPPATGRPNTTDRKSNVTMIRGKLARLDGESSNSLFDALDEWERHLRAIETSNTITQDNNPGCGDEHFGT